MNFGIAGVILTGFSAVAYRFLGTNKGERWLNRVIDRATERFYTQDSYPAQESAIETLSILESAREDGVLVKKDDGFDEALRLMRDIKPTVFNELESGGEIVKLERVDWTNYDSDELKERGVTPGSTHYVDAVMDDGSRKVVCSANKVTGKKANRVTDLRNNKERKRRRFRNRIEDGIKWTVILIGVCGAGLIGYGYL